MSDPLDPIMQAAERLRRLDVCSSVREVYPHGTAPWVEVRADRDTLSDFALSILPKGKRPVRHVGPTSSEEAFAVIPGRDGVFMARYFGSHNEWWAGGVRVCGVYLTEVDARLELHWQKFDALTR